MSAFNVPVMHSICYVDYFYSWDDGRDKNEIVFFILGTKSGEKKSYEPKWESCENVGTKIGFIPITN